LLKTDGSLKGSPQPGVIDTCNVPSEDNIFVLTSDGEDRLTDFVARPAKKAWRRRPPPHLQGVEFVGHGKGGRSIRRLSRNGEAQQEQKPLLKLSYLPIIWVFREHRHCLKVISLPTPECGLPPPPPESTCTCLNPFQCPASNVRITLQHARVRTLEAKGH
jgi:hypothetical protein